jgi:hypothetical protein
MGSFETGDRVWDGEGVWDQGVGVPQQGMVGLCLTGGQPVLQRATALRFFLASGPGGQPTRPVFGFVPSFPPLCFCCQVNEALLRVISMLDGPEGLMRPAVLYRVLLNKLSEFVPPGAAAAVRRAVQQYGSWLGLGLGFKSAGGFAHPEALLQLLGCQQ